MGCYGIRNLAVSLDGFFMQRHVNWLILSENNGANTHIHIRKKAEPGSNAEFCFLLQRKRELDNFSNSYIINNGNYQR